jgi:hypothetical protein
VLLPDFADCAESSRGCLKSDFLFPKGNISYELTVLHRIQWIPITFPLHLTSWQLVGRSRCFVRVCQRTALGKVIGSWQQTMSFPEKLSERGSRPRDRWRPERSSSINKDGLEMTSAKTSASRFVTLRYHGSLDSGITEGMEAAMNDRKSVGKHSKPGQSHSHEWFHVHCQYSIVAIDSNPFRRVWTLPNE